MEFFDWLNIPQVFLQFIRQTADTSAEVARKMLMNQIICLSVAGGLYLIGLLLGGFGLYAIAKRAGIKHGFLGFLPFGNTYLAGKIAGEASFFGQKMKRAGLYAMLLEIVYSAFEIMFIVINFLLIRPEYYHLVPDGDNSYWTLNPSAIPANLQWMYTASSYANLVATLLWFLVIVFFCVVFFAFFRKYYARSPFLMVFLCVVLPFRGFAIFAVRNNKPVDYNEYLRRRAEEYARNNPYGPYGGGYGPYGGNGGENGNGGNAPDPFSDFGSSEHGDGENGNNGNNGNNGSNGDAPPPDDPFSDF